MKYALRLFPIFLCCLLSCKDKEKRYYQITNQTLIDAVTIKKGSFFIYKDSVTNVIDSLRMYNEFYVGTTTDGNDYERYQFMGYELWNDKYQGFDMTLGAHEWSLNKIYGWFNYFNESYSSLNFLTLPFNKSSIEFHYEYSWNYIEHYDSLSVANIFYKDVYEIETTTSGWRFRSFYSLNNGLVKFITQTDSSYHSWSLIKSVIVH